MDEETIYLDYKDLTEIPNLSPYYSLEVYLSNNQITKIENLPLSLRYLDLFNNRITKIENLPEGLQTLNLSHNQIIKIENLPINLNCIDLVDNQITKIENLPSGLQTLYLGNNPITDDSLINNYANIKIYYELCCNFLLKEKEFEVKIDKERICMICKNETESQIMNCDCNLSAHKECIEEWFRRVKNKQCFICTKPITGYKN